MATANKRSECFSCRQETRTFFCERCSQNYCFDDLTKHLQDLHRELEELGNEHDQFRQMINDEKDNFNEYSFIKQIKQWEDESINRIKQMASL